MVSIIGLNVETGCLPVFVFCSVRIWLDVRENEDEKAERRRRPVSRIRRF